MTAPRSVVLLLATACGLAAGCGDDGAVRGGGGTRGAGAAVDGGFAGTGEPRAGARTVVDRGITYTPFARYRGRAAIAQDRGVLAVAVGGAGGLELRISRDGERPRRAEGAGTIPAWARIHVSSDDHGNPVVTYPRCSGAAAATCDLVTWSSLDHREVAVPGLAEPGRAEIDGAEVSGAAVGLVLDDPSVTGAELRRDSADRRGRLVVTGLGGRARTIARGITHEVAMGTSGIGELQGACGERRRLLDRSGRELFHQQSACGFNEGVEGVGLAVADDHLTFADAKSIGDTTVYDHRIGGPAGNLTRATFTLPPGEVPAVDWAAIDATSGYATSASGDWTEITRVSGLTPRPVDG
ncbi:MAG: hypothetical protein PGN13_01345 [Patulibacter minatonensis]